MNNKYVCIHGHFYQPPRENAWLEQIELQESAQPYHDWNDRITHECYGPNGVSRILNDNGRITDIVNNYSKVNFNFGPTLLSWLEQKAPKAYQSILDADKQSLKHYNGHGSAIAQVYNHIIMPLANRRDKETQVIWGLYDFEQRFQRKAEGIWLAETAVDTETLEILSEHDVKYTILAPRQAKQFRQIGSDKWIEGIDTKRPYKCNLPNGKSIVLFFYDGDRSQEVAFKGVLNDGKTFATRLCDGFTNNVSPELMHIATDGESYGHHHKNGDMALAYCIRHIEENNLADITNYSEYLSLVELEYEAEIHENSSWSCVHGIERWRSNCGCNSGGHPDWNQEWRKPLREALDWLRDELSLAFEKKMKEFKVEPWALRNKYIEVLFNRTPEQIDLFVKNYFPSELKELQKTKIIRLLEMQRQCLYMYTSCGWFFDEVSGIETTQILQYANRAIQLAYDTTRVRYDKEFREHLDKIPTNLKEFKNAKEVYETFVSPKRLSLTQVGMHYAVSSLFKEDNKQLTVLNYDSQSEEYLRFKAGGQIMALGRTRIKSRVTLSNKHFSFAILYLGNHHLIGNTSDQLSKEDFDKLTVKIQDAFESSNISKVIQFIQDNFKHKSFSFFDLLKDEQHKLLEKVLDDKSEQAINSLSKLNLNNYSLMNLMSKSNLRIPDILLKNLETEIEYKLISCLDNNGDLIPIEELRDYIKEVKKWSFKVNTVLLNYLSTKKLNKLLDIGKNSVQVPKTLNNIWEALPMLHKIGVEPELNELQDVIFRTILDKQFIDGRDKFIFDLAEYINLELSEVEKKANLKQSA